MLKCDVKVADLRIRTRSGAVPFDAKMQKRRILNPGRASDGGRSGILVIVKSQLLIYELSWWSFLAVVSLFRVVFPEPPSPDSPLKSKILLCFVKDQQCVPWGPTSTKKKDSRLVNRPPKPAGTMAILMPSFRVA